MKLLSDDEFFGGGSAGGGSSLLSDDQFMGGAAAAPEPAQNRNFIDDMTKKRAAAKAAEAPTAAPTGEVNGVGTVSDDEFLNGKPAAAPAPRAENTGFIDQIKKGFISGLIDQNPQMVGNAMEAIAELSEPSGAAHAGEVVGRMVPIKPGGKVRPMEDSPQRLRELADKVKEWGNQGADTRQAAVPSITSIRTDSLANIIGDAADYAGYMIGSGVGTSAPSIAAGVAGAAATKSPLGFIASAAGPSYVQNLGDTYGALLENEGVKKAMADGKITRKQVASIAAEAAVPMAALDAVSLEGVIGLNATGLKQTIVKRLMQRVVTGALTEGTTEGIQQVIQEAAIDYAGGDKTIAQQAVSVIDNAIGGALAGGTMSAGGSHAAGSMAKEEAPPLTEQNIPKGAANADTLFGQESAEGAPPPSADTAAGVSPPAPAATTPAPAPEAPAMTPAEVEKERPNSPRLTPEDRASPLPNDLIDDGKKIFDDALGGRKQAESAPAPEIALPSPPASVEPATSTLAQTTQDIASAATPGALLPDHEFLTSQHPAEPNPTPAQAEAGNYRHRHVQYAGLDISIENEPNSIRRGTDATGKPWEVEMPAAYGYVKKTKGADGDQFDVYLGPSHSDKVFVIDQIDANTKTYDEHKAMIGFNSREAALAAYEKGFSDGRGAERVGAVTEMPMFGFKQWLKTGDTTQPLSYAGPAQAVGTAPQVDQQKVSPPTIPASGITGGSAPVDVKQRAAPVQKGPRDIIQFLAGQGGIRDFKGELRAIDAHKVFVPGVGKLMREKGVPLDTAREAAAEMGYFDGKYGDRDTAVAKSTVADLLDLIAETRRGNRQYASGEQGTAAEPETVDRMQQEVEGLAKEHGLQLTDQVTSQILDRISNGMAVDEAIVDVIESGAVAFEHATHDVKGQGEPNLDDIPFFEAPVAGAANETRQGSEGQGGDRQRSDAGAAGRGEAPREQSRSAEPNAGRQEVTSEPGAEGKPQTVIPGAEKLSQAEQAQHAADERMKPKAPQKDAGELFDMQARSERQDDLFSAKPKAEEPAAQKALKEKIAAKRAEASQPAGKIEDFGEKIEGARKDQVHAFRDQLGEAVDIAVEPLSKVFPQPNYEKLAEAGVDKRALALIAVARQQIPAKPRANWKVKRWAEQVRTLRDFAHSLVEGRFEAGTVKEAMTRSAYLRKLGDTAEMISTMDPADLPFAAKWSVESGTYSFFAGQRYNTPKTVYTLKDDRGRYVTAINGDTLEDILSPARQAIRNALKKQEDAGPSERRTPISTYQDRATRDIFLGFKGQSGVIRLKTGFASVKDARSYMEEHADELQKQIDDMRRGPNERRLTNRPREGAARREGDVSPEQFQEAFGFRGVQFGNYVEGERRQTDLNEAFDGLMDLADVLGIPPRAISFNGTLGLAFGARGRGGSAAAHYEPDRIVINLTKTQGAGSLAHEWFHGLDNYFSRQDVGGSNTDFMTERRRSEGLTRQEVYDAFKKVEQSLAKGGYAQRMGALDAARSKPYWGTMREKAARGFEKYVVDRLRAQKATNDYLANIDENAGAYPTDKEMVEGGTTSAFDDLFRTIETKEEEGGRAPMFALRRNRSTRRRSAAIDAYVDQVAAGEERVADKPIVAGENPEVLEALGLQGKYLAIAPDVIVKAGRGKHGLTPQEIKSALKDAYNPLLAFEHSTGNIDLVTSVFDANERPIVIGVQERQVPGSRGQLVVSSIRTIHGKDNPYAIAEWADEGRLRYWDRDGVALWLSTARANSAGLSGIALKVVGAIRRAARLLTPSGNKILTPNDIFKGGEIGNKPGSRLKLSGQADIAQSVEQEASNLQAPVRPRLSAPSPTDTFKDQAQAVGNRLRAELDRLGLSDIGLRISETLGLMVDGTMHAADGSYFRRLITVALDADNPDSVLDHEAIHALRDVGAFGKDEWAILERKSRRDWVDRYGIPETYAGFSADVHVEEGIAHAYADWRAGRSMDGIIAKAFKKIRSILQAIGKAFGKDFRTADDVFEQVASGEIGNRRGSGTIAADRMRRVMGEAGGQEKFSIADPTNSEAFRRWFGDSLAVDENGNPLVVYHGSNRQFQAFEPKPGMRQDAYSQFEVTSPAFFFSEDQESARTFAHDKVQIDRNLRGKSGGRPNVGSYYLSVQNPLDLTEGRFFGRVPDPEGATIIGEAYGEIDGGPQTWEEVQQALDDPSVIDHLQAEGFDGVRLKESDGSVAWAVFDPTQIKSTDNRGSFAQGDPRTRFKLRQPRDAEDGQQNMQGMIARGQPIDRALRLPFQFFGGVDAQGRWKPGLYLADKATSIITTAKINPDGRFGWLAGPVEAARAGLIDRYGLSPEYIERDRQRHMDERAITMKGAEVLKTLADQNVSADEAQVLQAILTGEDVPDVAMQKLAEPIRQAIDELGQEAVSLGLVSAESFERNRGAYLHRVYAKHESEQNNLQKFVGQIMGRKRKQIMGDELKGRGLFWDVDNARLMRDIAAFKEGARGGPVLGEKFRVLDNVLSPTEDMLSGEERGKVARRVYVPADQQTPAQYTGPEWRDRGVWEVRKAGKNKITLWRDYTKAERSKMGEILDARYTIGKTYLYMAHDLATGRFYKDIAENEDWASGSEPGSKWVEADQFRRHWNDREVGWVKVPDTTISNTGGKKRWGALAGKFVRAEIWRDLNEIEVMNRPSTWRMLLTQWKLNKTARSPVVHMNNVMSNLVLMDMQDVRMQDLAAGLRSFINKDKHWQDANEHGVFGADMMTQEIRDNVLKPILEEIEKQGQDGVQESFLARAGVLGKLADRLWGLAKTADRKMIDLYRVEDDVFRLASYRALRARGQSAEQAAAAAREQFLDYDIRAPWVNAARNSLLPFISYTYRAVPLLARAMATRPWKLAKYAMIAYALNALAYAWDDKDEEDKERASLRDEEQGNTWLGTPRMMRMPWRNRDGLPVFLDIRRWIPGGDVFDTNQGSSAVPIPAPLQFGGPLMLAFELALNKSGFTGDPITNDLTDNWWDKSSKVGDYLWKAWLPSAAWVPNSWYWTKIGNAIAGATDAKGRPYSLPEAVSSSFGIKMKPQDVETGLFWHYKDIKDVDQALRAEARTLARQRERGLISQKAFDAGMQSLLDKRDRLVERVKELQRVTKKKP